MSECILGVDPGLNGACSILTSQGAIRAMFLMPVKQDCIDFQKLVQIFMEFRTVGKDAALEHVCGWHSDAASRAFNFGRNFGIIESALKTADLNVIYIRPVTWTRDMHSGLDVNLKPKYKSRQMVERLWPETDFRKTERSRLPHDGLVDACLIAEYWRRQKYM